MFAKLCDMATTETKKKRNSSFSNDLSLITFWYRMFTFLVQNVYIVNQNVSARSFGNMELIRRVFFVVACLLAYFTYKYRKIGDPIIGKNRDAGC